MKRKRKMFLLWLLVVVSSLIGIATNDLEWGLVGIAGIATMLAEE